MLASRVSLCARACDACARARGWQRERAPARRQIKKWTKGILGKFLVYVRTDRGGRGVGWETGRGDEQPNYILQLY